jgi:hypothetical protein
MHKWCLESPGSAVKDAIKAGVRVVEWLLGFGNREDQVGSAVFRFSHRELAARRVWQIRSQNQEGAD